MSVTTETTTTIKGCGGLLAVSLFGPSNGVPVVMAHSILTSKQMWQQQAHLLAAEGLRVICPDTRGHGGSAAPTPPYTIDDLADDVVTVLDGLKIDRAHFVGLSLGAMTGFGLGLRHPDRLLSLFLVAGRADAPPDLVAPWDERIKVAHAEGCGALASACLTRWFTPRFLHRHPEAAARLGGLIPHTSVQGFEGCARALQKLNYRDRVSQIKCATTLVVGAEDKGDLPQAMRELHARIPGCTFEEIAASGHFPNIDQTALFNMALLSHFERVAPSLFEKKQKGVLS